jgi:hypothetical protein
MDSNAGAIGLPVPAIVATAIPVVAVIHEGLGRPVRRLVKQSISLRMTKPA